VVSIVEPEANSVHGLNTRYMGCLRASFEAVITVDDDVLPLERTITRLLEAKLQHPDCLHATHGRNPRPGCVYNFQQVASRVSQPNWVICWLFVWLLYVHYMPCYIYILLVVYI
jgi:hypothetical protein